MTTDRQKAAVQFCEDWTEFTFKDYCIARYGKWNPFFLDNYSAVSCFLSLHLDDAKDNFEQAKMLYDEALGGDWMG